MMMWSRLLLLVLPLGTCHFLQNPRRHESKMRIFSQNPGVMVSFEQPIYLNGQFKGFDGWNMTNDKFRSSNVTYIVRVELSNKKFKENRIRRHFKRFWLPGAVWVERSVRDQNIYNREVDHLKRRHQSHVDIWVEPSCFLRHNGVSRVHRVAKSLGMSVVRMNWIAKINYKSSENYKSPELMQIGRQLVKNVPGIKCTWIHPKIESSFSVMIRFFPDEIPQKSFFSSKSGYHKWDYLNSEYQVQAIHFFRGWSRALVDFAGGINCRESIKSIGQRYQSLPSVNFVYLDMKNECRFTYQIVVSFDQKFMQPKDIFNYDLWEKLNQFYGAIHIQKELLAKDMKSIIEFEPGLYNHIQMKAIRDEYVKLPGIRFGWVKGKTAVQVSTLLLQFDKRFTLRMPLKKYNYWDSLNRRYLANITVIEEDVARAHIRFRPGAYSDLELKHILSQYRRLPGIDSVGMDTESFDGGHMESLIPKRRSLKSWLELSEGVRNHLATKVTIQGLDDRHMMMPIAYEHETASQCINVH